MGALRRQCDGCGVHRWEVRWGVVNGDSRVG